MESVGILLATHDIYDDVVVRTSSVFYFHSHPSSTRRSINSCTDAGARGRSGITTKWTRRDSTLLLLPDSDSVCHHTSSSSSFLLLRTLYSLIYDDDYDYTPSSSASTQKAYYKTARPSFDTYPQATQIHPPRNTLHLIVWPAPKQQR